MLFSYQEIEQRKSEIFKNWFEKYINLYPVFRLFFDTAYGINLYRTNVFLNLVFAIETYHRRTTGGKTFNSEEFERIKAIVISSLNDRKHIEWLKGKFEYLNEVNLRKRLSEIYDRFSVIMDEIVPSKKEFIHKILATRNYYVHYTESLKKELIKEDEFEKYNSLLKIILDMCLLDELGFSISEINKHVRKGVWNWSTFK
jgi:hypothetical protein